MLLLLLQSPSSSRTNRYSVRNVSCCIVCICFVCLVACTPCCRLIYLTWSRWKEDPPHCSGDGGGQHHYCDDAGQSSKPAWQHHGRRRTQTKTKEGPPLLSLRCGEDSCTNDPVPSRLQTKECGRQEYNR